MDDLPCEICGAERATTFARRRPGPAVLHPRFVRCEGCGAVYASPRADAAAARAHYSAVDSRGAVSRESAESPEWAETVAARARHLDAAAARLDTTAGGVRFLEVGFGDGSALAAAAERGWQVCGVEYGDWLVSSAASRLRLDSLWEGGLEDAPLEEDSIDVAYSWHVIEHVLDLHAWVGALARVVRPGGVVMIGTENARSLYGRLWMLPARLLRRTPTPPTSSDHTFWFDARTLGEVLRRHGFEAEVRVYENSPLEILRTQRPGVLRNPRAAVAFGLYVGTALASAPFPRLGGKLVAIGRRTAETS